MYYPYESTLRRALKNLSKVLTASALLLISLVATTTTVQAQAPEWLYYSFENGIVLTPEQGSDSKAPAFASLEGGMTMDSLVGALGSRGLVGTGGSSTNDFLDTGWPVNLYGSWTISFYYDPAGGAVGTYYLFGDADAFAFRASVNGSLAPNDLVLSSTFPGFNTVTVPGGAGPGPVNVALVYDQPAGEIRSFVDGSLVNTTSQPDLIINGFLGVSGSLKIGGYGFSAGMPAGAVIDEFSIYNRTLDSMEIVSAAATTFSTPLPDYDLAANQLVTPSTSDSVWGSSETIEIRIINTGAETWYYDAVNIEVGVIIEGPNPGTLSTVVDTDSLLSGDKQDFILSTNYDLSDSGTYKFTVYLSNLSGLPDLVPSNDTANEKVRHNFCVYEFPYKPRINSFRAGGVAGASTGPPFEGILKENWMRVPETGMCWHVEDCAGLEENTTNTGPLYDVDGIPGGTFLYLEADGGSVGSEATLISPCLDFSALVVPQVSFSYHMYGAGTGALYVEVDDGSGWTAVDSIVGQQQTSAADAWLDKQVSLAAYAGSQVKVRWRATNTADPTGDISLDEIQFFDIEAEDVGVFVPSFPLPDGCGYSDEVTVGCKIVNFGSSILTGFDMNLEVTGPISETAVENFGTGLIDPLDTANFFFMEQIDLSAIGTYEVKIWATVTGDINPLNDTAIFIIENDPGLVISTFPWVEDFNTDFPSLVFSPDFEDDLSDSVFNWIITPSNVGPGGTPTTWWHSDIATSTLSGPDADPVTAGGTFMYLRGTGSANNTSSEMYSPCIDLGAIDSPALSFSYHLYGEHIGTFAVRVEDPVDGLVTVFERDSAEQTSNSDPWATALIDLSDFAGSTVRLQFKGIKGTGIECHAAFDQLRIFSQLQDTTGVGLEEISQQFLTSYPNPAGESLFLQTELPGEITYAIYSSFGQLVLEGGFRGRTQVDLSELPVGAYYLYWKDKSHSGSMPLIKATH